ncbi:MAG: hypothetical protein WD749_01985 [Phycisphaerales bacterium]
MNILLVILLGWLCLGLDAGLRQSLTVNLGASGSPSFVIPLAVAIALCAPPVHALWACLALGLALDLTSPNLAGAPVYIPGPNAVGLLLGAQFILAVRGLVMRRNPLTIVVLSVAAAAISGIAVTAIFTFRSFYDTPGHPAQELASRLLSAGLTGGTAFVLSFLLLPLSPMLGLSPPRHFLRR